MLQILLTTLLWSGAVGCGLMAGVYFAFSTFIMASLARIETSAGILAMQSINEVILRSVFMPLFFGTSFVAAGAAAVALTEPTKSGALWILGAGATYLVGMFLCTVVFNVPLNNKLKKADPRSVQGAETWDQYLRDWTRWNHVRTVSSAASSILFFLAI